MEPEQTPQQIADELNAVAREITDSSTEPLDEQEFMRRLNVALAGRGMHTIVHFGVEFISRHAAYCDLCHPALTQADATESNMIQGIRLKCTSCEDIDICMDCVNHKDYLVPSRWSHKPTHSTEHVFALVETVAHTNAVKNIHIIPPATTRSDEIN